jgi:hypothetical protein
MSFATAFTEAPVDVDPSTGKGPEWGKAAPIGLLVILLLVIATYFLLRSMVRKINKVPASFDPPGEDADDSIVAETVAPEHPANASDVTGPDADPGSTDLVHKHSG